MRKISMIAMVALVGLSVFSFPGELEAAPVSAAKTEKTTDKKSEKTTDKKSPYEKFMTSEGLLKESGFVNILRKDGKVWLEIPASMIGKKVISSTRIESSTCSSIAVGEELSSNQVLVIDRTDSLILLRRPAANIVIKDEDEAIRRALSGREPILYSFPIRYRGVAGSGFEGEASYVVNADALFDISNKAILDLKGSSFDESRIAESSLQSGSRLFRDLVSFGNSVGIRNDATFEVGIAVPGFGFIASERPVVTLSVLTTLSRLPEKQVQGRIADSRIGTRHEDFTIFEAQDEIRTDAWAQRWDVQPADPEAYFAGKGSEVAEPVTIYVDTLLGPTWTKAVTEALMAWQPAFDEIGLHHAIRVEPYPSDGTFMSSSPLYSTVSFSGGHGTDVTATILADATSGQILSCRMMIPGDYISGVHRRAVFAISDVDPRYRSFNLAEDAVCDVLKADMIRVFGLCLGLTPNMAGSAAYSPEQLRDPEFTATHGITASVTDDVLFNYLAVPGDKERGVATIVDQIGAYDRHAIEWLYRPFRGNEKQALDSLIRSRNGQPEYFYAGRQRNYFDSRALTVDLGNDIFEAYDAGLSHLKYVVEHAHEWLDPDQMDDVYLSLFYDWLWMRFNSLTYMLSSHVGAINTNDLRSGQPRMEVLPLEVQRRALRVCLENYMDISWMESNKELMHLSGAYKDATRLTQTSILQISGLSRRLPILAMAEQEAGNSYSPESFMTDLRTILLGDAYQGRLEKNGYDIAVAKYLVWLISNSNVMKQDYQDFMNKTGRKDALRIQFNKVPEKYAIGLETLCYDSLVEARKMIKHGLDACGNEYDRHRFEFLLSVADAGLGN